MPLFPVLDLEDKVQERDKTRLDASKSYVSAGSTYDTITVQPSASDDAVDVSTELYLDWQYEFIFDIVTGENDNIDFSESGSVLAATLAEGAYTPAELAAEIQSKMRAVSPIDYVVTVSDENAFTIVGTSSFILLGATGVNEDVSILPAVGFASDTSSATSKTGEKVETIDKTVTVTMTKTEVSPTDDIVQTITRTIQVISETADHLFSTDDKLRRHEPNIMSFVPDGRSSWKNVHRRAQDLILQWLDTQGITTNLDLKFAKDDIHDIVEVTDWATVMCLQLIFEGLVTAKDDIFEIKAKKYKADVPFYQNRAILRIDTNDDGSVDLGEQIDIRSCTVVRR